MADKAKENKKRKKIIDLVDTEQREENLLYSRRFDLPTPLNFALPEEILKILSDHSTLIKDIVPSSTYSPASAYTPTTSFSAIIDEREMDIPAQENLDTDLYNMTPETVRELQKMMYHIVLEHVLKLVVSSSRRNDTIAEVKESLSVDDVLNILTVSKIYSFRELVVWRLCPGAFCSLITNVQKQLGYTSIIIFTEESVSQMANLGHSFCTVCPWALLERFETYPSRL